MRKTAVLLALLLTSCGEDPPNPSDGATLLRVCRDGTRIWRYRDGSIHAGPWGHHVEDADSVCQ